MKLTEDARERYIESIFDTMTEDDDNLLEAMEEGEDVLPGEVHDSESEDNDNEINEIPAAVDSPMQIEHDTYDDESDNDMDEESTPIFSATETMIDRDGTQCNATPPVCQQIRSHNIIRTRSGPLRMTENMSGVQCFKSYFTVEMVDVIVRHTNKKATATYDAYNEENPAKPQLKWKYTSVSEIYAFIGMLIMAGANHFNDENAKILWD